MSTESIIAKSLTLSRHKDFSLVFMSFTISNGGAAMVAGQECIINGNMTIGKRTLGTQFPIGVVDVGGADGTLVAVATCFQRSLVAHCKGAAIAANAFVKPNGTVNADGSPEYVATVAGDYVSAICISGGILDAQITLGVLSSPFQLN